MFPNEIVILMALEEAEVLTARQLNGATDVTGAAFRHMCNSLVRRGYLESNGSRGYRITAKGKETLNEQHEIQLEAG